MPTPVPPYPASTTILDARIAWTHRTTAYGDMWPQTWAADGRLYAGAGDNEPPGHLGSPMNLWRADGEDPRAATVELVNNYPVDIDRYTKGAGVHRFLGLKPAGLIHLDGVLYMSVENINYGDRPLFNRQHNLNGWIITSRDYGKTWDCDATPQDFFTGRLASCHFLQAGRGDENIIDGHVYAYFPCGMDSDDSWWCNGDRMLLGRVRPQHILDRTAWKFLLQPEADGTPRWCLDVGGPVPVFSYPRFCGENHVSYNPHIKRYILANYAFYNPANGEPRPYHTVPLQDYITQLSLYEAENPWGPWHLFLRDDDWLLGGYQPSFPVKWMAPDGRSMTMLGSGNNKGDRVDYCFLTQGVEYDLAS